MKRNHPEPASRQSRARRWIRTILSGTALLLGLWILFIAALVLTVMLPRDAMADNLVDAAEYYKDADMFEYLVPSIDGTLIHHYADALLLNILVSQDPAYPYQSAMDGLYYQKDGQTQGQNLADAVNGMPANTIYSRYWHGMLIFLAPLLCLMPMSGIKIVGAVVLILLAAIYFACLIRRKMYAAAVSSGIGLVLCHVWIVPLCVEYYACFALLFVFSDIILLRGEKLRWEIPLFICAGALCCFFDFLTCEILTLGVPLVCLLLVRNEDARSAMRCAVRCASAWLIAYALTWLCRWVLSAAVVDRSISEIALGQAAYRMTGSIDAQVSLSSQPFIAILLNLSFVFPFSLFPRSDVIWVVLLVICLIIAVVLLVYHRPKGERGAAAVLFLVALLPFVRFFLISNHAAMHSFFTYRDLFLTVLSVGCGLAKAVRVPARKKRRRR